MVTKVDNDSLTIFGFIEVEGKLYPHLLSLGFGPFAPTALISTLWFVYVCFESKGSILEKLYIIDLGVYLRI